MAATRNLKKNDNRPVLALQIGHTRVRAILFRLEQGLIVECQSLEEDWQQGDLKFSSVEGIQGLKVAFRKLLNKLPRGIESAFVALSGEFCVTRVVSDTNENVLHEVREIESRSSLYLSLGHGPKVVAGNILQQDPKHQHATVSVVHRQTIESILEVAKSANLTIIAIEPTVISICRLMGAMGLDQKAPTLLVSAGQSGVEIAISYQGHLYLDYRPAGIKNQEEIAEILVHHLERLQRYCRRHARVMKDAIASVYLTGERYRVEAIQGQLGDRLKMPVWILETAMGESAVAPLLQNLPVSHFPAAGVGLLAIREYATPGPNLMERLKADKEEKMLLRILRVFGPLAAVIVIATFAWGYVFTQNWELQKKLAQAAALEPTRLETLMMRSGMTRGRETLNMHKQIGKHILQRPESKWIHELGQNVPENAWLTSISLDSDGDLTVEGNVTEESSIFDYAQRLRGLMFVERATVNGATPTNTKTGPAIKFTIHCDIDDWANLEDRRDDGI